MPILSILSIEPTVAGQVILMNAQLDDVASLYLRREDGGPNLFEVWEKGEGRGDSVTPSTYSAEYRRWMRSRLLKALRRNGPKAGLLSLGSGNAVIEAEIAREGYRVLAVDAMQEAVELALVKGVDALRADITTWSPDRSWPVVYMDGVLGHLYDPTHGLLPALSRVRSWLEQGRAEGRDSGRAVLIASNDAPKNGESVQPAPGVPGFHWLAAEYMRAQALSADFAAVSVETFRYRRPLSGERVRSVIHAEVA